MQYLALAMPVILGIVFLALIAHFAVGAWKGRGLFATRDRWQLLTRFISAVATCAVATLLINWVIVPGVIWLIGVALLAIGVAGAALRWSALPWFADGSGRPRRIVGITADLLISALFISAALA